MSGEPFAVTLVLVAPPSLERAAALAGLRRLVKTAGRRYGWRVRSAREGTPPEGAFATLAPLPKVRPRSETEARALRSPSKGIHASTTKEL